MLRKHLACLTAPLLALVLHAAPALALVPAPQALQGAWAGSDGRTNAIFMFTGNTCAININGMQMPGVWNLMGNRLNMQFQNGSTLSYSVDLQGDTLILDGSMRLSRQGSPGGAPQGGTWGMPQGSSGGAPQGGTWGAPQAAPLDGTWSTQTPQGVRAFRFMGNRYVQTLNGQVMDEGVFTLMPDGRFQYRVTGGAYTGQSGENRLIRSGNSFTMFWPGGQTATFTRDAQGGQASVPGGGQAAMATTPLEGRWIWAKQGPVSFGYIFSGHSFIALWNGAEQGRGSFTISGMQLTLRHEAGAYAGKTDVVGYQVQGNRLLIFPSDDPNVDPIPFVRQ